MLRFEDLPSQRIVKEAKLRALLINAALRREVNLKFGSIYTWKNEDGSVQADLTWDFTKASNLTLMDERVVPFTQRLITEIDRREMTALKQWFQPEEIFAVEQGSVMDFTLDQIHQMLELRKWTEAQIKKEHIQVLGLRTI